ncbi:MAG: Dph6-related ATP pyrophosphatase, partial [Gemmatirosa sp.]
RVGLPLHVVTLPWPCPNEEYERRMRAATTSLVEEGFTHVAFGDVFLDDVRAYRERALEGTGLAPLFPLWGRDTLSLSREMVEAGLDAWIVTLDPKLLDPRFAGRRYDTALLDELPAHVDPCGERGEFHTFVHDGPIFRRPVPVRTGEIVERGGFAFADLLPG